MNQDSVCSMQEEPQTLLVLQTETLISELFITDVTPACSHRLNMLSTASPLTPALHLFTPPPSHFMAFDLSPPPQSDPLSAEGRL